MYLFSRHVRLTGSRLPEAIALAAQIGEHATQIIGFPMSVWTRTFSPDALSIAFTTTVPDMVAMEAAGDKLNVDGGFQEQVERAMQFVVPGSIDDHLDLIVYPTEVPPPASSRLPEYASVVLSTITNGQMARGAEMGVEVAQAAEKVTGHTCAFLAGATGNYGSVGWLIQFPDINAVQKAWETMAVTPEFSSVVERAAQVFAALPGGTTETIYRRVV